MVDYSPQLCYDLKVLQKIVYFKKIKQHYHMTQYSTPRYISKRNENKYLNSHLYTNIHSSIILKSWRWKLPKCSSGHEWVNKLWCVHIMEYYQWKKEVSITYRNMDDLQKHAEWKKPDTKCHIMCDSSWNGISRLGKFLGTESKLVIFRDWGEGEMGNHFMLMEFSFWAGKLF